MHMEFQLRRKLGRLMLQGVRVGLLFSNSHITHTHTHTHLYDCFDYPRGTTIKLTDMYEQHHMLPKARYKKGLVFMVHVGGNSEQLVLLPIFANTPRQLTQQSLRDWLCHCLNSDKLACTLSLC